MRNELSEGAGDLHRAGVKRSGSGTPASKVLGIMSSNLQSV
jgi:hypothetical protein